ncbi:beta-N-acetylhexosaminidase [Oleiagrimonas sp.]|jgi:beta-N-acetylhexosaminidase|uniref:beta-N-acetylhexosaminidase n=1 Tax=Oleiagrimonas sp. TaxID=2010330 RepID=UPI00260B258F|nr:beta-N-acetylhexosaminidase [Oleiagrimonas sp.]MDA3914635.1 beta-N-acetylhexosaminidase [Oleiagrimonas sp.]
MLLIGIAGITLTNRECEQLASPLVSGVVLFTRNFQSRVQVSELIAEIRKLRPDDGFIVGVDQEGGVVQRFRDGFTRLPALAKLGALHDRDPAQARARAEEHAWIMASELRAVDVDISFAPVVDLARGNRIIGSRAFHAHPEVVAELADAYVRGMHMAGMAVTLKHFPGHGSVLEDTHVEKAVDARDLEAIRRSDLVPFTECIRLGVEAVMMAHVIYPAVDTKPAGQSGVWIEDVLRTGLGFEGLVFSDDISMAGAGEGGDVGKRLQAHVAAGCDLILACQPAAVEEALATARGLPACAPERVATMRGEATAVWSSLMDNPQRDVFIARLAELEVSGDSA